MTIKGTLHKIFETNQVSDKFRKREFVLLVADNPQYPEHIKMEVIQDNCEHLDGYHLLENIEVDINIKGREYKHPEKGVMYFVTLQAWRIRKAIGDNDNPDYMGVPSDDEGDNLPF